MQMVQDRGRNSGTHIYRMPQLRKITNKIDYHKIMTDIGNPLKKEAKMIEKLIQTINDENTN